MLDLTPGRSFTARLILYSVDFRDVERLQLAGDWLGAGAIVSAAARSLELAGADFLVLCTNTMHKTAPAIEAAVKLPLPHIADPTAVAIVGDGYNTVGLLGTRFTMEQDFYRERLRERHGIVALVPERAERDLVHRIIYEELCLGKILPESRMAYARVMAGLASRGAQAIILGCTEITMLVDDNDATVPLFDTTSIHTRSAAEWAVAGW